MELNMDARLNKFANAVISAALSQKEQAIMVLEEEKKKKTAEYKNMLLEDSYNTLQKHIRLTNQRCGRDVSQKKKEVKAELINVRNKMFKDVFAGARGRINTFLSSAQYKPFILRQFENAAAQFGKDEELTCFILERDTELVKSLPCKVEVMGGDFLGGFMLKSEKKFLDCTLRAKLSEQEEHFVESSGLTL